MAKTRGAPPREVTLVYKKVAGTHTFYSMEVPGLIVGNADLEKAFGLAIDGLSHHISRVFEIDVKYDSLVSYDQFRRDVASAQTLSQLGFPLRSRIHEAAQALTV